MKTIAITGTTSGIGRATTKALARKGHKIIQLARDEEKAVKLKEEIVEETGNENIDFILCDLADLRRVKRAAKTLKDKYDIVDVLINNAGGIFQKRRETKDGLERTFQINHLSHFLLTNELLETFRRSDDARIINVSSQAHKSANPDFSSLQMKNNYISFRQYGNVKLYNIWHAKELHRRYFEKGISSFALHPGTVNTDFDRDLSGIAKFIWWLMKPFMKSPDKGAETSVMLATKEGLSKYSGLYFKNKEIAKPSKLAKSKDRASRLWELSKKLIAEKLESDIVAKQST